MSLTATGTLTVQSAGGAATFPTWRQGLSLNQWSLLAGSSMSRVNPTPQRPGNTGPSSKIITWTSMAVDPSDSSIYSVANGGHHDYSGNEADRIRMSDNAPQWDERRPSIAGGSVVEAVDYYSLSPVEPTSTHSYYGMFFVASRREVITIGGARWDQNGGPTRRVAAFNIDTNTWAADDTWQDLPAVLYTSDQNAGFCQDLSTGDIYGFGGWSVYKLSATTRVWTQMLTDIPSFNCHNCPSAYDTTRRRFLIAGGLYTMHHVYDIDANTATAITFTGAQASTVQNGSSGALVYVPALDKYIYKGNVSGGALVQIDPVTFDCTTYATTGGSTIPQAFVTGSPPTGLYNKLLDLPRMACLALVTANDTTWSGDNVWVIPYSNSVSDFAARIAGPNVVWYHGFNSANEVNNFRWANQLDIPSFNGNDPTSLETSSQYVTHVATGGPDGGGFMRQIYPAGQTRGRGGAYWHRPYNPLQGGTTQGNGRGAGNNDPGANGSIATRAWPVGPNTSITYSWGNDGANPGYYMHPTHQATNPGMFQGHDFYISLRVRRASTPGAPPDDPGGYTNITGKCYWITLTMSSNPSQELVHFGYSNLMHDQVGVQSQQHFYVGQGGAGQTFTSILGQTNLTLVERNDVVNWRYSGGWDTILIHIIPGTHQGTGTNRTRIEEWAQHDLTLYPAERGRWTKMWDATYTQPFDSGTNSAGAPYLPGWNSLILATYHNGSPFTTSWQFDFAQVIFSKAFIPPPTL